MTIPTWSVVEDLAVPAPCAQVEHAWWRMSTVVVNCVVMCLEVNRAAKRKTYEANSAPILAPHGPHPILWTDQ